MTVHPTTNCSAQGSSDAGATDPLPERGGGSCHESSPERGRSITPTPSASFVTTTTTVTLTTVSGAAAAPATATARKPPQLPPLETDRSEPDRRHARGHTHHSRHHRHRRRHSIPPHSDDPAAPPPPQPPASHRRTHRQRPFRSLRHLPRTFGAYVERFYTEARRVSRRGCFQLVALDEDNTFRPLPSFVRPLSPCMDGARLEDVCTTLTPPLSLHPLFLPLSPPSLCRASHSVGWPCVLQ